MPGGRAGQARPRGGGRDQAEGQRQPAQGDELWADEAGGAGAGGRGRGLAGGGRGGGRRRGRRAWRGPARRRDAGLDGRQATAAGAHPRRQGGAGGRGAGRSADLDPDGPGPSSGMQERGRRKRARDGGPPDRAQRNFTDPDSRILPTRDGFIAGYNGQIAVDAAHQIIVAHRLETNPADYAALVPLVDRPRPISAASPARSPATAASPPRPTSQPWPAAGIRTYLAPGRSQARPGPLPPATSASRTVPG